MRRFLADALPHVILIAVLGIILLPLIWLLRVASPTSSPPTRSRPRWAPLRLDNFVEIFVNYNFAGYFLNSWWSAIGSTAIALPLATAMAYAFARYNTGGAALRLVVLASQMLPPVILVLPLYSLVPHGRICSIPGRGLIIAHLAINMPFLAWMLVAFFRRRHRAARTGGPHRRRHALPGLYADRRAGRRHPACSPPACSPSS